MQKATLKCFLQPPINIINKSAFLKQTHADHLYLLFIRITVDFI